MSILGDIEEQRRRARGAPPIDTSIDLTDPPDPSLDETGSPQEDAWIQRSAERFPMPRLTASLDAVVPLGPGIGPDGRKPGSGPARVAMDPMAAVTRLGAPPDPQRPAPRTDLPPDPDSIEPPRHAYTVTRDEFPMVVPLASRARDPIVAPLPRMVASARPAAPQAPAQPPAATGSPDDLLASNDPFPAPGAGGEMPDAPVPPDDDTGAALKRVLARITSANMPAPQSMGGSVGPRASPAPDDADARARASALSSAGPIERFLQDFASASTSGRLKPNYGEANRLDALAQRPMAEYRAERDRAEGMDLKSLQRRLIQSQIKKNERPEKGTAHSNDGLETAKFNAQWKLDHPEPAKPAAPGDPTKAAIDTEKLDALRYANAHRGEPKAAPGLTPGQQATEDRSTALRRDANKQSFSRLAAAQSGLADTLVALDKAAPGVLGGDTKGMPGQMDSALAQSKWTRGFSSDAAQQINALKARIKQMISLDVSGKVLNGTELANMETFLGLDPFTNPKVFADSLSLVRQSLRNSVKRRDAAYGKTGGIEDKYAILDEMRAADPGLLSATHPAFAGMADEAGQAPRPDAINGGAPTATVRVRAPDGKTGTMTRAAFEAAVAKGKKYEEVAGG